MLNSRLFDVKIGTNFAFYRFDRFHQFNEYISTRL